jgi:2-oxoglutarate dehydrogenase E2 component (dihydrolipoamide succinyltransferase)
MTDHVVSVPQLGESVVEATIAKWFKRVGDPVAADEPLVELETDKVSIEVPAPISGTLASLLVQVGQTVAVGSTLAMIDPKAKTESRPESISQETRASADQRFPSEMPERVVRKATAETVIQAPADYKPAADLQLQRIDNGKESELRVPITQVRREAAIALKSIQNTAAMLSTFNEIDLTAIDELRSFHVSKLAQKNSPEISRMSFIVGAVAFALQEVPGVNAVIEGDDIVNRHYFNVGVPVTTPNGTATPVIKNANMLSVLELEQKLKAFTQSAKDGVLSLQDMQGATLSISDASVGAGLISTSFLRSGQPAILSLNQIKERVVAIEGKSVVRSMMYVALTYDHRLIDGKEAVTFLIRIKERLEEPRRGLFAT